MRIITPPLHYPNYPNYPDPEIEEMLTQAIASQPQSGEKAAAAYNSNQ